MMVLFVTLREYVYASFVAATTMLLAASRLVFVIAVRFVLEINRSPSGCSREGRCVGPVCNSVERIHLHQDDASSR